MGFMFSIANTEATFFAAAGIVLLMFIITLVVVK
jgi:hypothetical protein